MDLLSSVFAVTLFSVSLVFFRVMMMVALLGILALFVLPPRTQA